MYLLTNVFTMLPVQQALSAFRFGEYKCACVIKFQVGQLMNILMKMASNSRSNLCSRGDSLLS